MMIDDESLGASRVMEDVTSMIGDEGVGGIANGSETVDCVPVPVVVHDPPVPLDQSLVLHDHEGTGTLDDDWSCGFFRMSSKSHI